MGRNTGRGGRIGLVKDRRQTYNSRIKKYVKIDTNTGKILKTSSTKFKGVRMISRSKDTENTVKKSSRKKSSKKSTKKGPRKGSKQIKQKV